MVVKFRISKETYMVINFRISKISRNTQVNLNVNKKKLTKLHILCYVVYQKASSYKNV